MAKVILKDIEKIYTNGFKAVHGINLEIEDGEFIVLVGPSGCGKSTTLRMIAGLEEVSSGTIVIGDEEVNNLPPKDRGIAMVFQNYALYPHMNVFENMAFGLKMQNIPKKEIESRVLEVAKQLELIELLKRKPKELSGGQKQRVALGRAIVKQPRVFLFDEPLSNLDAKLRVSMRVQIMQLHKKLKEQGKEATMIYVTHDQVEAMTMGDRICVLNGGEVMQIDTPLELYNNPKNMFVAGFIGTPPINFISGRIIEENKEKYFQLKSGYRFFIDGDKFVKLNDYIGKEIVFGIRPEDIHLIKDRDEKKCILTKIENIEDMGYEKFIYFNLEEKKLVVRVVGENYQDIRLNEEIKLFFDISKGDFFDINTQENILYKE